MTGSEDIGNGMKAGINIEMEVVSNNSSGQTMKAGDGGDPGTTQTRQAHLFFSGNWGKVSLGQLSDAQDGTSFADLSNTWIVNEFSSGELGSSLQFHTSTSTAAAAGPTIANTYSSFDGGRRDGIRYDSPALGPVTAAVSIHTDSRWAAGLYASTSLGGGELSAAVGYQDFGGTTGAGGSEDQWSASASYLFSQGTSITLGYGESDGGAAGVPDPDAYYAKLGHQWGSHAVSIHYAEYDEVTGVNGDEMTMWGLGWVYTMRNDIELYAGYNNYDLDRTGTNFDDIDIAVVGSRIKF